jgi:hypothetical protein
MNRTDDECIALAALAGAELEFTCHRVINTWVARDRALPPEQRYSIYGSTKAECARVWLALHDKLPPR